MQDLITELPECEIYYQKNKVYGNLESLPYLDQCLSELKFGENNTNIPDQKMYQDPYDALFYGSYPYRFKMGI